MPWIGFVLTLLLSLGLVAAEPAEETRRYSRTGSIGSESDVEVYLLEGTYRHEISSTCTVAASLFPGNTDPAVELQDVLQADLITRDAARAQGTFTISIAGWAMLQAGTGPDCQWSYAVTGSFLPVGEEPPPPRSPDDLGSAVGGTIILALLVVLVVAIARTRRSEPEGDDERVVKVWVAPPPE
jgi:hypothetical protein